jgi:serine O-acetyltransferase
MSSELLQKLNNNLKDSNLFPSSEGKGFPDKEKICTLINGTLSLLFPGYFGSETVSDPETVEKTVFEILAEQICRAFSTVGKTCSSSEVAAGRFMQCLPELQKTLLTDVEALYVGDPAAKSRGEVLLCYPGFFAVAVYRMAHELYKMHIPLIPRIMTEYAHGKTGIDIHPGATVGEYFFIDHGTGIVIGETAVIGDHVRLYQGVTLGAKSFEKDKNGNPVKNLKRHPNIGSNVIIYANATILGGNTYIGDNSIIGASTWIVNSVPAGSTVIYSSKSEKILELWGDNGSGI